MILLLLDPASRRLHAARPTGPGPSSVPGIPQNLLPIFEAASQQFGLGERRLGVPGGAERRRVDVRHQQRARHRRPVRINSAGAAGPMQIGIGGAATDNWDTIVAQIPPNLPGGATATQRLQRDRRRLRRRRAAQEVGRAR